MTANRSFVTSALFVIAALFLVTTIAGTAASGIDEWTATQLDELRSLSLGELEPLPPDPTNRVAGDPRAATLGERLFFDTRLSANGSVACSTCHQAERDFEDGL